MKIEKKNKEVEKCFCEYNKLITILIQSNADLNCINNKNQTPLSYANEKMKNHWNLMKGISSVKDRNDPLFFDNNTLLKKRVINDR